MAVLASLSDLATKLPSSNYWNTAADMLAIHRQAWKSPNHQLARSFRDKYMCATTICKGPYPRARHACVQTANPLVNKQEGGRTIWDAILADRGRGHNVPRKTSSQKYRYHTMPHSYKDYTRANHADIANRRPKALIAWRASGINLCMSLRWGQAGRTSSNRSSPPSLMAMVACRRTAGLPL